MGLGGSLLLGRVSGDPGQNYLLPLSGGFLVPDLNHHLQLCRRQELLCLDDHYSNVEDRETLV